MRRKLYIVSLIVCAASCSPPSGGSKTTWHVDATHRFRFRYPVTWNRIDVGATGVVMFTGGTSTQISVSREKGGEREIADMLTYFKTTFPRYEELDAGWRDVNGRRAYLHTARWNSPMGDIAALRMFLPVEDHFFIVTASTPQQQFERYLPLLRACVLSFEVTE
ncbi:MAG: hypothetical protein AB1696_21050 [Planctomycetota bacterium]